MNLVAKHFDGNADWATNFPPKCDPKSAEIPVNGFTTIAFSCIDPDAGFGATPPTPTPLENEAFEIASQPAHGTLGGLSNGKVIYTPNKDFSGTDTFTYTGSDGTSNAPPATVTIHVVNKAAAAVVAVKDTTAPTISGVKMSAKRWRLGSKLASISAHTGGHDDLLQPQRGGPRNAHLPAQEGAARGPAASRWAQRPARIGCASRAC